MTFPLEAGGWFDGKSVRYVKAAGVSFKDGMSLPLKPWKNIAVDPGVIPMGSKVFVPAYCPKHGWMVAGDTGGAIQGLHIDVYRSPPRLRGGDQQFTDQRIYVIPPGKQLPAGVGEADLRDRRAFRPLSGPRCTRAIHRKWEFPARRAAAA